MFEHIKKRIIKGLIEEIICLDATGIELVGHQYISIRENQTMVHHGLNKDHMPSGYTVDTFSDDSSIIGEYSAEKGYFNYSGNKENPIYSKIQKDILHALQHKEVDQISSKVYLISNQEENPSFRASFNSTDLGREHSNLLIIIDARELAKGIYDQSIKNPVAADFYKQYFPTFSQNIDNYEYFGKLPNICDEYIFEENVIKAISNHFLDGNNVCILHGVSGSGKTQSAIDFVKLKEDVFPNYIWISGNDWVPNSSLCSVQRSRGGSPVNIAGLFNAEKSILVIDNYTAGIEENGFEELTLGFQKGGVVLVTSQISVPDNANYVSIPQFSIDNAFDLLGETKSSASELCRDFISKCRFSPLILSITKNLCRDKGIDKETLYREILGEPELIDDPSGMSIVRKILSGLESRSLDALKKIANSGKNYHDIEFLRYFIGILRCNTLQKLSILVPDNIPGVFRIHDLISIATQDEVDSSVIVSSIEEFISSKMGDMTPSALRQIHLCSDLILEEHMRRGTRDIDWLHYSLLQFEGDKKLDLYPEICDLSISANDTLVTVKSVIDAREIYSYTILNITERKSYYISCAFLYDELLQDSLSEEVRFELLHHKGKALRRSEKYDEALDSFNKLLELKPEWHATYGQIAHLGTQSDVGKDIKKVGEEAMRNLLDSIQSDIFSVPLRVSLAALARLRSYREVVEEINDQEELVKKLADLISISALEGLSQFYEAFVSFTSLFGYRHSAMCVRIVESIPELIAIPPNQVDKSRWLSACEALTNSFVAADREYNERLSNLLIISALTFADEISNFESLTSYEGRVVAKAYNFAGRPRSAVTAIAKVQQSDVNHWLLYEEAKSYLALGGNCHNDALSSAKKCFELAKENQQATKRISIYHDLLSRCYIKLKDKENATIELGKAIDNCNDDKYKYELQHKLDSITCQKL